MQFPFLAGFSHCVTFQAQSAHGLSRRWGVETGHKGIASSAGASLFMSGFSSFPVM